jgi:hypothetical protein
MALLGGGFTRSGWALDDADRTSGAAQESSAVPLNSTDDTLHSTDAPHRQAVQLRGEEGVSGSPVDARSCLAPNASPPTDDTPVLEPLGTVSVSELLAALEQGRYNEYYGTQLQQMRAMHSLHLEVVRLVTLASNDADPKDTNEDRNLWHTLLAHLYADGQCREAERSGAVPMYSLKRDVEVYPYRAPKPELLCTARYLKFGRMYLQAEFYASNLLPGTVLTVFSEDEGTPMYIFNF